MSKIIIVGSNSNSTAEYYKKLGIGPSELVLNSTQNYSIGHTAVHDITDLAELEKVLSGADEVYWAHSAVDEFSDEQSYYDFLYWLNDFNLTFGNVKNFKEIQFDPYSWKAKVPTLTADDIVFFGGSITAGAGLSNLDSCYTNIIARHYYKNPVNMAISPGIGNNFKTFDLFTQTSFVPGQMVVVLLTPLERIRYCLEDSAELVDIQFSTTKKYNLIEVYNRQFLFYNLVVYLRAMVEIAREKKLKLVILRDNYKTSKQSNIEKLYFYEWPEFFSNFELGNYLVDFGDDDIHPGIKSHQLMAEQIIQYINKLYK